MSKFTDLLKEEQEVILKERPRWCHVEYNGVKGCVSARFLAQGSCTKSY